MFSANTEIEVDIEASPQTEAEFFLRQWIGDRHISCSVHNSSKNTTFSGTCWNQVDDTTKMYVMAIVKAVDRGWTSMYGRNQDEE
jgi:hypothetical protein